MCFPTPHTSTTSLAQNIQPGRYTVHLALQSSRNPRVGPADKQGKLTYTSYSFLELVHEPRATTRNTSCSCATVRHREEVEQSIDLPSICTYISTENLLIIISVINLDGFVSYGADLGLYTYVESAAEAEEEPQV